MCLHAAHALPAIRTAHLFNWRDNDKMNNDEKYITNDEAALKNSLEHILAFTYSQEINLKVESFWDSNWSVTLGDEINGWELPFHCQNIEMVKRCIVDQLWLKGRPIRFIGND